ncbi:MAG: hypothetical protein KC731_23545 [Myxococcales bacterium]|nr:hypothetical protein [Myxococcales bacterium]
MTIRMMIALAVGCSSIGCAVDTEPSEPAPIRHDEPDREPAAILEDVEMALLRPGDPHEALAVARRDAKRAGPAYAVAARRHYEEAATSEDPLRRWTVVTGIGHMRVPETRALLQEIASEPLPAHAADAGHGDFAPAAYEQMIRARAIEALRDLAIEGDTRAASAIVEGLEYPDSFLRVTVVHALLDLWGDTVAARARLRGVLREEDHWMLGRGGAE